MDIVFQISQAELHLVGGQPVSSTVGVDETLANHCTFLLYYQTNPPFVDIRTPSGVIYGVESDAYTHDSSSRAIKIHFDFTEVQIECLVNVLN